MISPSKLIFENDVTSVIQIRLEKMQRGKCIQCKDDLSLFLTNLNALGMVCEKLIRTGIILVLSCSINVKMAEAKPI